MIFNEPSFHSLNNSALRFHYSAWEILFSVIGNFDDHYHNSSDESEVTWHIEWQDYLKTARYDLEAIFTNIAQANELALRSRICQVSPFLLLINSENRFKANSSGKDIDFTELRTIDAVDLPGAVNAICDQKLSDKFVQNYNQIRSIRNKVIHLGEISLDFDTELVTEMLTLQYSELWQGNHWLKNWIACSGRKRQSHFFDYKNYTEYTDVLYLVPQATDTLTKSQFNSLFGFPKSKRRYICYDCCSAACIERHGADLANFTTAILKDENILWCSMCEEDIEVERKACCESYCKGNVIFENDYYSPVCCTCGLSQE